MSIRKQVEQWLDEVVIGQSLCPFAARPRQNNRIEILISDASSLEELMSTIIDQCIQLTQTTEEQLETLLIVVPSLLDDFDDYLDYLELANQLVLTQELESSIQIASFHPKYQFEDTEPEDRENLTNCSPYPIFHLLRQSSVTAAIDAYGDTSAIPERNKQLVTSLSAELKNQLFPYLKD